MGGRVHALLQAGWTRRAIADELGVNPTTVTRHARLLGFSDSVKRRSPFDWVLIQKFYDEGHTIKEVPRALRRFLRRVG